MPARARWTGRGATLLLGWSLLLGSVLLGARAARATHTGAGGVNGCDFWGQTQIWTASPQFSSATTTWTPPALVSACVRWLYVDIWAWNAETGSYDNPGVRACVVYWSYT